MDAVVLFVAPAVVVVAAAAAVVAVAAAVVAAVVVTGYHFEKAVEVGEKWAREDKYRHEVALKRRRKCAIGQAKNWQVHCVDESHQFEVRCCVGY